MHYLHSKGLECGSIELSGDVALASWICPFGADRRAG